MKTIRQLHRWVGLGGAGFLLLTVITGLLWAYAPHLYWKDDYKKKKNIMPSPPLAQSRLGVGSAMALAQKRWGQDVSFSALLLRPDFGRLVYEVRGVENDQEKALLLDALTGEMLSPISESVAITIARQYVPSGFLLNGVSWEEAYTGRDGRKNGSAYTVKFQEGGGTEIVIDQQTGQILEEQDRVRRFHFWVMRFHQLNFLGFKKTLTIIPGTFLLALIFSGLRLWSQARRKKDRPLAEN